MPLNFPGQTVKTLTDISIRSTNSEGQTVVVKASHEVIRDTGSGARGRQR
jgi:hypothetical protein